MKRISLIVFAMVYVAWLGGNSLSESFEGVFPPSGWANPGGWDQSSLKSQDGSFSAHIYRIAQSSNILSTPKLNINQNSVLSFWSFSGTANGKLEIVYSSDRNTWTQLAEINHPQKDTWYQSNISLSSKAGNNYYLGFRTGSSGTNFYLDMVSGLDFAAEAPGAATLTEPVNGAPKQNLKPEFKWGFPTTGGVATGYKLYLSTINPPEYLVYNGSNTSYLTQTDLQYDTVYYWRVDAYNSSGSTASAVRSFRVKENPIKSLPYYQGFENETLLSSLEWTGDMNIMDNHGKSGSKGLCRNLSTSISSAYAISPPIAIMSDRFDIEFDYRYVNSLNYPNSALNFGSYNKLEIQASFNNGNFTTLYTVNSSNHTATTAFTRVKISIGDHAQELLRLKFSATWGSGDYYLDIDNVAVQPIFDFPVGTPVAVGEAGNSFVITMSGGAANTAHMPEIPPVGNSNFRPSGNIALELQGEGPWTICIGTSAPWGAYYRNGNWHGVENTGGQIVMPIAAVRAGLTLPIILGNIDPSLAVELSAFTVSFNSRHQALLTWVSESESELLGYYILRNTRDDLSSALQISELILATNGSQQQIYVYTDKELSAPGTYYYWLQACNMNGSVSFHGPIIIVYQIPENGSQTVPLLTGLHQLFPNPFNPHLNICYQLADADEIELKIYNTRGQLLRLLDKGSKNPGQYRLLWDATDERGQSMGSGIYFVRLQTQRQSYIEKVILLK